MTNLCKIARELEEKRSLAFASNSCLPKADHSASALARKMGLLSPQMLILEAALSPLIARAEVLNEKRACASSLNLGRPSVWKASLKRPALEIVAFPRHVNPIKLVALTEMLGRAVTMIETSAAAPRLRFDLASQENADAAKTRALAFEEKLNAELARDAARTRALAFEEKLNAELARDAMLELAELMKLVKAKELLPTDAWAKGAKPKELEPRPGTDMPSSSA